MPDDETVQYDLRTHNIHPDQQVVDVLFNGQVVASFYGHSRNGQRSLVVFSKHITDAQWSKVSEYTEAKGLKISLDDRRN